MRKILTTALATIATVSVLTACNPSYGAGPAGTVSDRSAAYFKSGGWRYRLTVTMNDGQGQEFRVSRDDYRSCFRGSAYPSCMHRTEGSR
ncbi:hypothetical protein [Streptomyces chartreusis]|uniref:hypothetical protein n=1 Tax=Streptomyces chartreusis TaxID=1969 RepID=UPI00123DF4B1|nr:hypothetical protein [Streptomyces chartreusis]QEV68647.1 hypothetical protein CP983_19515 [Streptomyces chartreusis]GGX50136.1 hypothetical protein GCM10010321_78970 [Streptomyces chartreusis]